MRAWFQDREEAGHYLAEKLQAHRNRHDVVVLALPRGGVPIAYEVATRLHLPLDVFIVRKLGIPGWEELAMGAIASGGGHVVNEEGVRHLPEAEKLAQMAATKAHLRPTPNLNTKSTKRFARLLRNRFTPSANSTRIFRRPPMRKYATCWRRPWR